jgi:hypothetical protein
MIYIGDYMPRPEGRTWPIEIQNMARVQVSGSKN